VKGLLNKQLFDAMCAAVERTVEQEFGLSWSSVDLIGHGNAWSDHIPVALYLKNQARSLTLYPRVAWDEKKGAFEDTGVTNWKKNPGGHENFSMNRFLEDAGVNGLADIQAALAKGASLHPVESFKACTEKLVEADYLICFTWATGAEPDEIDGHVKLIWTPSRGTKALLSFAQPDAKATIVNPTSKPASAETPKQKEQKPAKEQTPAKEQKPAKGQTPAKEQKPAKGQTPAKAQKPAKEQTPAADDEEPEESPQPKHKLQEDKGTSQEGKGNKKPRKA